MLYEVKNPYKRDGGFVETIIEVSTASELDSKILEELKVADPGEGGDDDKSET